ncbi:gamma-glutamylcyclotransferase family protein [Flagellimonas myxillae]|uniref:gamma-glutamylcyclotransferase family protein n=1 Tax=Flagellimonas myxillae TaxID=2942214 RepID=UPI00201EF50B|nr:gamma-glutamylcyclotransferase family protein [Muricauda myxillae]MCL6267040.1 gamma-glutamylcyclotransferase [Muricauda myxillae]
MEFLFTYGTLQDEQVQQYIFGRTLKGNPDFLPGFKIKENAIYGRYPLVLRTDNPKDKVQGIAYKVTTDDLTKADIYETSAYKREKFTLVSGVEAWLYVKNSN